MPRSSSVSEKVWAQAIHAVTVQKMSLRRAAQLYGVHHMSLHRRVRGRYMTNQPSRFEEDFQLSSPEEQEALLVLREQFLHEGDVSADDVRYVVRTIASQDGRRDIPSDFPLNRWISNFKRVHGLSPTPSPRPVQCTGASGLPLPPPGMPMNLGLPPQQQKVPLPSTGRASNSDVANGQPPLKYAKTSGMASQFSTSSELFAVRTNSGGSSSRSSTASSSPYDYYPRAATNNEHALEQGDSTSESESEHHRESMERMAVSMAPGEEKRCRQSNTVSAETWDKAMDAVEVHGMSLRTAAKAFGVHFAALHRRLKKRALKKEQSPPLENYIPFEDEAGIVRVIHARADLGLLMGFDELVDLLNRTALKYTMVTPDLSRAIVRRFQSRVEQSIRHLIKDWPLPRLDAALYRYHSGSSPRGEEKMPSPLPPQLPALFPRNHAPPADAKGGIAGHLLQQVQREMIQQQQDAYARARYGDDGKASPMEIEQRTSILRL
jgi:hypothetical protein